MLTQQPAVGTEIEERAVERSGTAVEVSLDDANTGKYTRFMRRLAKGQCCGTRNVDRVLPVDPPELPPRRASTSHCHAETESARVTGNERLGQKDQPGTLVPSLANETSRLFGRPFAIEEHRAGLSDGDLERGG